MEINMEMETLHIVVQICTFPKFVHCDTELQEISMLQWFAEIYGFTPVAVMFCISVNSSLIVMAMYYLSADISYFQGQFLCGGNIPSLICTRGI